MASIFKITAGAAVVATALYAAALEDCLSVESFPEWLDQQEIEEVINE